MEELAASHRLRALDLAPYHADEQGRGDTFQRIKKYIGLRRALRSVAPKGLCAGSSGPWGLMV